MAKDFKKAAFTETVAGVRMPPQNLEAEVAVLGSLMLDAKAIIKVVDSLAADDFYRSVNRDIYGAMLHLFEKNEPIDVLSVSTLLRENKKLDGVGGVSYLTELVNAVPSASNVAHYAEIVRKKSVLRNLIDASHQISQLGYQEESDVSALLDDAEKKIFGISQRSLRQSFTPVHAALAETWNRIDNLHKNSGQVRGVRTGFAELDKILSGMQDSDLVILAARPSVGKTSMALDIARHAAVEHKVPVGIFSLEMSTDQLTERLIAAEAKVDLHRLRTGALSVSGDDFTRVQGAMHRLSEAPIYIDDEGSNTILQMRAMARRLQAEHGLGMIVVDYLQMIQPSHGTIDNMVQHITEVSRSLKMMAKELKVPVLALAQLSRAVEMRHPPIPRLADLRDSGSIEQDADVVMFIYREDRYKQSSDRENQADILISKHRNGPTGQITLYFNQNLSSFSDMADSTKYGVNF
jgi:replicative DNA helicase